MQILDQATRARIAAGAQTTTVAELQCALTLACLDYLRSDSARPQQITGVLAALVIVQAGALGGSGPMRDEPPLAATLRDIVVRHVVRSADSAGAFYDTIGALEACKLEFYRRIAAHCVEEG